MAKRFASGKKALGICDVCGFQYLLKELKNVYTKGRNTNVKACSECWDPDHPQLRLGEFPVDDPQALRDPRPDSAELAASRRLIIPVRGVIAYGKLGQVIATGD